MTDLESRIEEVILGLVDGADRKPGDYLYFKPTREDWIERPAGEVIDALIRGLSAVGSAVSDTDLSAD